MTATATAPGSRPDAAPAARPGRPKSAEKATAIRRAAGELFLREGFARTSMDAVAGAAGVSKNTVYSHFASKEALFGAVIGHEVNRASALFGQRVPASLPLPTALRLLGGAYQRIVLEDKAVRIFRTVIGESVAHPDVARLFAESAATMTQAVFETFIAERAAAGELQVSAEQLPAAASLLQTLLRGELHTRALMNLAPPTDAEREAQLAQALAAFERLYTHPSDHHA